jgi:hypothetical protein
MSALAALYVQELANGNVPNPNSEEARAYGKYSSEYEAYRRNEIATRIVKESALKVYGHDYYLLGSIV